MFKVFLLINYNSSQCSKCQNVYYSFIINACMSFKNLHIKKKSFVNKKKNNNRFQRNLTCKPATLDLIKNLKHHPPQ